jgi:hypothetical protein
MLLVYAALLLESPAARDCTAALVKAAYTVVVKTSYTNSLRPTTRAPQRATVYEALSY